MVWSGTQDKRASWLKLVLKKPYSNSTPSKNKVHDPNGSFCTIIFYLTKKYRVLVYVRFWLSHMGTP